MKMCSIDGCGSPSKYRGWCIKHYSTWYRNGDPLLLVRRPSGEGTKSQHGYVVFGYGGKKSYEHIHIAEKVLGRELPSGAEVHHVDGSGLNNEPSNLVICPNHAYHRLLHKRARAFDACGHAHYYQCWICKTWGTPEGFKIHTGRSDAYHPECWKEYCKAGKIRRATKENKE